MGFGKTFWQLRAVLRTPPSIPVARRPHESHGGRCEGFVSALATRGYRLPLRHTPARRHLEVSELAHPGDIGSGVWGSVCGARLRRVAAPALASHACFG